MHDHVYKILRLRVSDFVNNASNSYNLEHIFEPFYTTKMMGQSGTGLGLSMVWNIVHDHEGHISVTSSDKGTTFELIFPISAHQDALLIQETDKDHEYQGNNEHILVVDDEPQLRAITSEMLKTLSYRVSTVSSGEEALAFLKKNRVDLAIIDMQMGAGMNGRQTIEKIKALKVETKIVIASGYSENQEVQTALKNGAICFIHKPCTLNQLGKIVAEALNKKPA